MSAKPYLGIHNGSKSTEKRAKWAGAPKSNPDKKAHAKLAQRTAQHLYAISKCCNPKNASCMQANFPGSLNVRNH